MNKSFKIDSSSINMRIDRWIRNNIGKIPQSLVEKNLRIGKIKLNKKKVKSSVKLKLNDEINFLILNLKKNTFPKKLNINLQIRLLKKMKI
mgnify:CR=1 FL=1